jgi:hypothetical protein
MGNVTIEFYGSEYGDWFFHCHILYHMMGVWQESLVMTLQGYAYERVSCSELVAETTGYSFTDD